ncbi:MAG: BREX system P-loop protein BrxC, partial [Nitrospirota bacterium]|nr:BREX system P-loop protein BrxC [Nitrospirota bacterium]
NQARRARLVTLLGQMLAEANYYAAGQPLKLKATTPYAALDESLGYLVKNTFNKMGYLKRLSQDPLKEIQAIIRSNDIGAQTLILGAEEGNKLAIDDVRNYVALMSATNKQVILQDMIDKRYTLRPYGWPEDEVVMLIARLLVLGEISLMMEGALIPLDKAYDAITTPSKRRKIVVIKRQTTDPKAIQDARALGNELFHEMGPDGEDALFAFLQNKLKGWQSSLMSYKPLADIGDYPGKEQIADGIVYVKKLLTCDNSYKFIQQLNEQKNDLLDLAENFTHLEQFYEHQKPTWEKLRKAYDRFQRNHLELERHIQARIALKRMQEILKAPSPYSLIQETEGLIASISTVNSAFVTAARQQAMTKINGHLATVTKDIEAAKGDAGLHAACVKPLEALKSAVQIEDSLAHITQAETEALKEFDIATSRIEEFVRKATERPKDKGTGSEPPIPILKKKRVIEPAKLVPDPYLETQEDVECFLQRLRTELEQALAENERIEIR